MVLGKLCWLVALVGKEGADILIASLGGSSQFHLSQATVLGPLYVLYNGLNSNLGYYFL